MSAADLDRGRGDQARHELSRHHGMYGCTCGAWHGDSLAAGVRHLREIRALDADRDGRDG